MGWLELGDRRVLVLCAQVVDRRREAPGGTTGPQGDNIFTIS